MLLKKNQAQMLLLHLLLFSFAFKGQRPDISPSEEKPEDGIGEMSKIIKKNSTVQPYRRNLSFWKEKNTDKGNEVTAYLVIFTVECDVNWKGSADQF